MSYILPILKWIALLLIPQIQGDTINCIGDNTCTNERVSCASGESCTVNCDGDSHCQGATIECPKGHDCTVNCIGGNAGCRYANIQATDAKELWLTGCGCCSYQCYSMEIYCPPQMYGIPKCHITGPGAPRNFDIWAINGFNDVDFSEYTGGCYGCGIGAFMYCEQDWSAKCVISDNGWNCDPTQPPTICDDPPPLPSAEASNDLSFGWIFIIVLVVGFVLYCIIGYVYKSKKNQHWKHGNIPNYSMWKSLPVLVYMGCKVTYQWLTRSNNSNEQSLIKSTDQEIEYDL